MFGCYSFGNALGFNFVLLIIVIIACIAARIFGFFSYVLIIGGLILNTISYMRNFQNGFLFEFMSTSALVSYIFSIIITVIGIIIVRIILSSPHHKRIEEETDIETKVSEQILLMQNEEESIKDRVKALYWLWDHITYPASDEVKANILKGLSNLNDDEGKTMNKSSLEKMLRYYCKEFSGFTLSENSEEKEMLHKVMNDYFIK